MVKALLDSGVTGLVVSLKFARKQGFKWKRIKRPIYIKMWIELLIRKDL